nr:MAG TPA: hypothetical protein [Caudoviricetes sp.]
MRTRLLSAIFVSFPPFINYLLLILPDFRQFHLVLSETYRFRQYCLLTFRHCVAIIIIHRTGFVNRQM